MEEGGVKQVEAPRYGERAERVIPVAKSHLRPRLETECLVEKGEIIDTVVALPGRCGRVATVQESVGSVKILVSAPIAGLEIESGHARREDCQPPEEPLLAPTLPELTRSGKEKGTEESLPTKGSAGTGEFENAVAGPDRERSENRLVTIHLDADPVFALVLRKERDRALPAECLFPLQFDEGAGRVSPQLKRLFAGNDALSQKGE